MDTDTQNQMTKLGFEAAHLFSVGQFGEAEAIYRQMIQTVDKHQGPEATYRDQYNLSGTLVKQDKFEEAELILRPVLGFLTQRSAGRDHHGSAFLEQEAAARRLLSQALAGQGKQLEEGLGA